MGRLGAIVLAGGRGSRLGGVDKGALRIDGSTLLDRALAALGTVPTVVVGPQRRSDALVTREDPPFTGPAAAVVAGLASLPAGVDDVLLLAVDVPALPAAIPLLTGAASGSDGVVAVDAEGRAQWLLGRYRRAALTGAAARLGDPVERSLRALLGGLDLLRLPLPSTLAEDVDTVADARRLGVTLPPAGEEAP